MEKLDSFTIRIYALIINENKLLTINEPFWGKLINKFPGGGLEFGESIPECLARELKEELNLKISSLKHFYTQEDFIRSGFKSNEQLFTVYYNITCDNLGDLKILENKINAVQWLDISDDNISHFDLPVDKIVFRKLLNAYSSSNDFSLK